MESPTPTRTSTIHGQAAVVAALAAATADAGAHSPWIAAADLAGRVGAASPNDAQFQADVQALFEAGTIRLMAGGNAGGASFYEAMLVPPAAPILPADPGNAGTAGSAGAGAARGTS